MALHVAHRDVARVHRVAPKALLDGQDVPIASLIDRVQQSVEQSINSFDDPGRKRF